MLTPVLHCVYCWQSLLLFFNSQLKVLSVTNPTIFSEDQKLAFLSTLRSSNFLSSLCPPTFTLCTLTWDSLQSCIRFTSRFEFKWHHFISLTHFTVCITSVAVNILPADRLESSSSSCINKTQVPTVARHGMSVISMLNGKILQSAAANNYEGWNFNSGNYLFTTDTK